jgi:hypothetical protein
LSVYEGKGAAVFRIENEMERFGGPMLQNDRHEPGSMLWPQFSATFANFRRKKWSFFSNTKVMVQFLQKLAVV